MNSSTTLLLSKKGMKELKKSIQRLERLQADVLTQLKNLDKTDGHDQRLPRVEKLSELEIIESQLADKQMQRSQAKLFPRKRDAIRVALGSVVELIDSHGRMFRYQLVDSIEANPSDGRISTNSPLGQTLLGRTLQETIDWRAGLKSNQLTLVRIS